MTMLKNFILLSVLFVLGCASSVDIDYDQKIDFSKLQTFNALQVSQPKSGDVRLDSPLLAERINKALFNTLRSKGYVSQAKNPDFFVTYHLSVKQEIESRNTSMRVGVGSYGYRGGVGMTYGYPGYDVYSYEKGILTIDILSGDNKTLIWRGSASRELKDNSTPEKTDKAVKDIVAQILGKFPPEKE